MVKIEEERKWGRFVGVGDQAAEMRDLELSEQLHG